MDVLLRLIESIESNSFWFSDISFVHTDLVYIASNPKMRKMVTDKNMRATKFLLDDNQCKHLQLAIISSNFKRAKFSNENSSLDCSSPDWQTVPDVILQNSKISELWVSQKHALSLMKIAPNLTKFYVGKNQIFN